MRVPAHAREGGVALLSCQYDLEDDDLYSVKWYKGNKEFYRFVPRHQPSIIAFNRPGVHVNVRFVFTVVRHLAGLQIANFYLRKIEFSNLKTDCSGVL